MQACEILFNPSLIGMEAPSITEMLINSIQKVDLDLRSNLYQDIILSGGTTLLRDFPERFIEEIRKKNTINTALKCYAPPQGQKLCWIGGSILSGLHSFRSMWITKQEWEENGESILRRKTF